MIENPRPRSPFQRKLLGILGCELLMGFFEAIAIANDPALAQYLPVTIPFGVFVAFLVAVLIF